MGQTLICPTAVAVAPPPMVANVIGTWSYRTVSQRMKSILRTVLATFAREELMLIEKIGAFGRESLDLVLKELEILYDGLTNNRFLTPLTGEAGDVTDWNRVFEAAHVDGVPPSWHDGSWLYVECFLYRKLYDILDTSGVLQDYDYFHDQKVESFENAVQAAHELATGLLADLEAAKKLSTSKIKAIFIQLMMVSLWGNRYDLTLTGGVKVSQDKSPMEELQELSSYILVDETSRIFSYLNSLKRQKKRIRVDFVSDNAGFELFADLCLADFLTSAGLAQRITFHIKEIPWFVSDTTQVDIDWLMERLKTDEQGPSLPELSARWRRNFRAGAWEVATSPFWTSPHPFCRMKQLCHNLYWRLQGANLLLFKGDLNYRKLLANRPWPVSTAFCRALDGFHPAPLVALRVLKADLVVGMTNKTARAAAERDADWMTCGEFAVIQMCHRRNPLDAL
ncbi:damage-control phosphatase ARMT1-like [Pollicipes pollicipes]|uniref:damage-control phosphatase ARMT1-like n=1 Tax=Pollicipes pollicipes TaxID=41117 RepID=UPI0018851C76|nr:damage-control phosphatase ARMT1-like [Pollicipes pollicipes]